MSSMLLPMQYTVMDPEKIRIVGVGGAGLACMTSLADQWASAPELIGIDSDESTLNRSGAREKIFLEGATHAGMGTGRDLDEGRRLARDNEPKLRALFQDADILFVTGGLGGGTAGAVLPELCRLADEEGLLIVCLVSMPFKFEELEAQHAARESLSRLADSTSLLFCYPHERLKQESDNPSMEVCLQEGLQVVAQGIQALYQLLTAQGLINMDFSTLETVCRQTGGGGCLVSARATGDHRNAEVVDRVAEHPYLDRGHSLAMAKALLVVVLGGPDLRITDAEEVVLGVRSMVQPATRIYTAVTLDASWKGQVGLTLLVAEEWSEVDASSENVVQDETPGNQLTIPLEGEVSGATDEGEAKARQTEIDLEPHGKGRFRDVTPTFHNGEDLDIPTYRRRGIQLAGRY